MNRVKVQNENARRDKASTNKNHAAIDLEKIPKIWVVFGI
jgi:hypothetical protein